MFLGKLKVLTLIVNILSVIILSACQLGDGGSNFSGSDLERVARQSQSHIVEDADICRA